MSSGLPAERWREIAEAWEAGRGLAFFLDFDGTLAPLAPTPGQASMPAATRAVLAELHSPPRREVWVVTGRRVAEALWLVGLPQIGYAGVHGLEIRWPPPASPRSEYPLPLEDFLPAVRAAREALRERLASVPGCLVEDKEVSVAVHYRLVSSSHLGEVLAMVEAVADAFPLLRLQGGHQVWELRPRLPWDKGRAVLWVLEKRYGSAWWGQVLPVYAGDDLTDEDAFSALGSRGFTVKVGEGSSAARCCLAGPEEVAAFLRACAALPSRPAGGVNRASGGA